MSAPALLIRNARIWTGVSGAPRADAVLLRDGRIAAVGRASDIVAPTGAQELDAAGAFVTPGFTDAHAHLLGTGAAMRGVDLKGVPDVAEAVRRVAERAAHAPPGDWLSGAGWDQHAWPGGRFPTRRDLDAVAPDRPVVLAHTSGHCSWVNTAALRAAGIDAATPDPPGGAIDRDADGEPSGILRDAAMRLVAGAAPGAAPPDRLAALRDAVAHAHRLGITAVHAMDVGRGELQAMRALDDSGRLALRVHAFLSASHLGEWVERGVATGDGSGLLRIGGVKFFADGALGSLTAWISEPYEGTSDTGFPLQPPDDLERDVRRSLEHGLAPAVHAIGDRANTVVLDMFARLRDVAPHLPRRIEHAQLLHPAAIPRFAALGVVASMQPVHATQDMAKVDRHWGARGRFAYAVRSLAGAGATLAFGSDTPVETMDPIAGLHAAVTRRDAAGRPPGGWYAAERIAPEAALAAYTAGAAHAVRTAAAGRIAPGCYADLTGLTRDVLAEADSMRILEARVAFTIVAGAMVYRRGA